MVERASDYHVSFRAVLPAPLLGNHALFKNHDVTNPRELYSMLSESKRQKGMLLTSLSISHPTGARLPSLQSSSNSSEVQFRPLGEQTQHSSYRDLVTFRQQDPAALTQNSVRRSASLQDVSNLENLNSAFNTKKLKPILRGSDSKNEQHEKAGVKFGHKEVRLIKDHPLPPIEGGGGGDAGVVSLSYSRGASSVHSLRNGDELSLLMGPSPQHHLRYGPERAPEVFPRGQPVKVEKPVTPTYDDYPEAYWELRSPTVQEPCDLKEDMIDRDRYRLQQISTLHLRAMNREVVVNRLDTYPKWQQQLQELSPPLHSAPKQNLARGLNVSTPGLLVSARSGKQQRMSLPIRNHTLAVAAKSISPPANPANTAKPRNKANSGNQDDAEDANYVVVQGDDELHRVRIEAAARAAGEKVGQGGEVKPLKASVVNLCMEPDRKSHAPTSDVYTGIRRVMFGTRPQSDKTRTQFYVQGQNAQGQDQGQNGQGQDHGHQAAQTYRGPGSVSLASNNATLGSSHSNRLQRVTSAPNWTPPASADPGTSVTIGDYSAYDSNVGSPGSKFLLKKFNKLQVFGEQSASAENDAATNPPKNDQWDNVPVKPVVEKHPYRPQNRPPTFRLDMRNYPPRRHGSAGGALAEEDETLTERGGYPFLSSERGGKGAHVFSRSSDKSEATALSFRFRNGEVIVSRQGKKPNVT
ncbi:uncharacterized protein [Littorina saxatilis]|uniref:Uncharacterized protein n=1 Tax=Littorina saxatilis TaxID=31220 RepID=A0AAN9GH81_9CAEN